MFVLKREMMIKNGTDSKERDSPVLGRTNRSGGLHTGRRDFIPQFA